MGVADWDLTRKHKPHGCKVCKHNPMGICQLAEKEVPIQYVVSNGNPKWCPKPKKGEK